MSPNMTELGERHDTRAGLRRGIENESWKRFQRRRRLPKALRWRTVAPR
jgi:hypothetical protein